MHLFLFSFIPVLFLAVAILALAGSLWHFYRRAKRTAKDLFGTDSLSTLVQTREAEQANTPKSVSGMTSLYVPQIQKDFPELNWVELKGIAENHLKQYMKEHNLLSPHIHKTEIRTYLKQSGTCIIVFQSSSIFPARKRYRPDSIPT